MFRKHEMTDVKAGKKQNIDLMNNNVNHSLDGLNNISLDS